MAKLLHPLYDHLISASIDWSILSCSPNYRVRASEFDAELVRLLAPYYLSVAKRLPPGKKRSDSLGQAFRMYGLFADEEGARKQKELLCEDWLQKEQPNDVIRLARGLYLMWPSYRLWCLKFMLEFASLPKHIGDFSFEVSWAIDCESTVDLPTKEEHAELMEFLERPDIVAKIARNGRIQESLRFAREALRKP